jgi:hypothetical protein
MGQECGDPAGIRLVGLPAAPAAPLMRMPDEHLITTTGQCRALSQPSHANSAGSGAAHPRTSCVTWPSSVTRRRQAVSGA